MSSGSTVDGELVQWGERLFYPSNRTVKPAPTPRLDTMTRRKAAVIRRRIDATVTGRAPQVMVKVTGGGRGMAAIAAHFRYISKNGRLAIEDDRGVVREGKEALHDLAEQWRLGGSLIGDAGHRREAFNIMLSMPRGTDARMMTLVRAEASSPVITKSMRLELCGNWYSMATPASSGISSSPSTLAISSSECFQACISEGPTPLPVALRYCRDTTSSMSSRKA